MSEKRYRVDEGEHGYYFIVDQKRGRKLPIENKMQAYMQSIADLLNQQESELDTLTAQNRELREALNFYANAYNWRNELIGRTMFLSMIERDNGETARKALGEAK